MPIESLLAIDVALLPPPPVSARAIDLSAVLPADQSHEFRLDANHQPHITLSQHFEGDARVRDVLWVAGYRLKSSFGSYTPHITLGHGGEPPWIEPFSFEATTAAVCHLGRFCTCRRVLRQWTLS